MNVIEVLINYLKDKDLQLVNLDKNQIEMVVLDKGYPNIRIKPTPWSAHPKTEELIAFLQSVTLHTLGDEELTSSGIRFTAILIGAEKEEYVFAIKRMGPIISHYLVLPKQTA